ncbi:MAG: hypothetical protein ACLQLC_00200 [Candidatus Sulfotelmatobacter sp.]
MGYTSSAAELRPAWARWLMPSAGDAIFVALLAVLTMSPVSVRLLGDAGIGWHIRTGQMILSTHSIPLVDPFSSSMAGQPWFAWEWLYDVIVGWLESVAGLNGVVAFTALVIAVTFAWTFRLLLRRGVNLALALMLVLLAASASMIHFLARPHVLTWLFSVAWFWALESREERSSENWKLWLLPLTMLLWVNLHGGFLVGFVLLAIYWLAAAWQFYKLKEDRFDDALRKIAAGRRIRTLSLVGVSGAAATFVNPYGFRLHLHIYRYLSNRFLMDHIDEFQSPNFHYVAQKCFAGLLLLTLVALAARRREVTVTQGLVLLFAVYSGLYASRNIPVSSLLLILVIGPWLANAIEQYAVNRTSRKIAGQQPQLVPTFLQRMSAIEMSLRGHLWPIAAILLMVWIAAHDGKIGATTLMDAQFNPKRFPVQAVDYLEAHNVPGPIVSTDSWGGYLIYRFYPRVRTVVDDRHDFYGEKFFESYLKMVRVEPGWQDFLQQHEAGSVIVPKNSPLANILEETRGWRPIYGDDTAVVFVPNDSAAQSRSEPMLQNPSH